MTDRCPRCGSDDKLVVLSLCALPKQHDKWHDSQAVGRSDAAGIAAGLRAVEEGRTRPLEEVRAEAVGKAGGDNEMGERDRPTTHRQTSPARQPSKPPGTPRLGFSGYIMSIPPEPPAMSEAERRAEFVYEVCRLEAIASKRPIVPETWWVREAAFRAQCVATIERLCADAAPSTTPEAEHESWMRAYEAMGWRYGPHRDPVAKTHPDMVPFNDLPQAERDKDAIFLDACDFARRWIRG